MARKLINKSITGFDTDITSHYELTVNNHNFSVYYTEVGAINEDNEETTGFYGLYEITPEMAADNNIIDRINDEIGAEMYEPQIITGNNFYTYITEPPHELSFIDEGSPDDLEKILDNIEKIIDEMTK